MGSRISASRLTQEDFDLLAAETSKPAEDIKKHYEDFLEQFPDGIAPKEDFVKWFPVWFFFWFIKVFVSNCIHIS